MNVGLRREIDGGRKDHDVTVHSIVSAVDFSEQSRQALRWAGVLAAKLQSRLTVISVVDPLLAEAARIRLGLDLAKEAEPALRDFVAATWPNGAPTAQVALKTTVGEAATAILGTASSEAVALITAGTQGLGGLRKWLLGSTTERLRRQGAFAPRPGSIAYRVLTSTTVPVLVVPAPAAEGVQE